MVRHGRYTVVRKLAEGGMAEIFLAKQHGNEGFEKPVVLKRIHTAFYADAQFRDMLVDEAHISMGLQHANIVQILDLGRAGGRYFLVLELVDGWDLAWILQRAKDAGRPLPVGLGLYVMAEVCRALAYAHTKTTLDGRPLGLVHRDISPQNVLISDQGDVKLADFGIAKARRRRESSAVGVVKGKIAFMAPEQALGKELDARSDLYAVGILLYLLATGKRPYDGTSDLEILLRVQKGAHAPAEEVAPQLSPALAAVIRRAMAFDPEQRYGSADELLVELEEILRSEHSRVGKTELKLWLMDLSRLDGVPPISRATPDGARLSGPRPVSGFTEEEPPLASDLEIELGDERSEPGRSSASMDGMAAFTATPEPGELDPARPSGGIDGHGHLGGVDEPIRMTGREPTSLADVTMPFDDDDLDLTRGHRTRRRRRRTTLKVLVTGALLAGGAGAAMYYAREHRAGVEEPTPAAAPALVAPTQEPVQRPSAESEPKREREREPERERERARRPRPARDDEASPRVVQPPPLEQKELEAVTAPPPAAEPAPPPPAPTEETSPPPGTTP